jgi:hypothetical protein
MHNFNGSTQGNLIENFNIEFYPHGVLNLDGKIQAHFKALITILPNSKVEKKKLDFDSFYEMVNEINSFGFGYNFSDDCSSCIRIKAYKHVHDSNLKFYKRNIDSKTGRVEYKKVLKGFDYGKDFEGRDSFRSILSTPNLLLSNLEKEEFIAKQFAQSENDLATIKQYENVEGDGTKSNYHESSKEANKLSNSLLLKNVDWKGDEFISFISLYSHILDEPIVAEDYYGIIRSFFIPVEKFSEDKWNFEILFQNEVASLKTPFLFKRKKYGQNLKFYNGLSRPVLNISKETGDFKKVWVDYVDSYHNELNGPVNNQKDLSNNRFINPEGIFLKGIYKDNNGVIDKSEDPFENNEFISGYNMVVVIEEGDNETWRSLGLHERQIQLLKPKRKVFKETYSGLMHPQTNVESNGNNSYRSNLFMAWKGENLMVNRISKNDKNDENDEVLDVEATTIEYSQESQIMDCQFQGTSKFIRGGNVPLFNNHINELGYKFYMRLVIPTGYYPLTKPELNNIPHNYELNLYTIPAEDIFNPQYCTEKIKVNRPSVKAPIIVGSKNYQNSNSDYVDRADHLVINLLRNERREIRRLFPPEIKFQDFRFEGNLRPERIGTTRLSTFINRCINLEERSKESPPAYLDNRTKAEYLADLRSGRINCYPADLFTRNSLRTLKGAFQIFEFNTNKDGDNQYPYYRKTKGARINLEKKVEGFELSIGDHILYRNLKKGSYRFYLKTEKNVDYTTAHLPFNVSIIGKPDIPEFNSLNKVERDLANPNYWRLDFELNKEDITSKGYKFIQETEVLRLQSDNLRELLNNYVKSLSVNQKLPELLENEFPYQMFLDKEGSIESKDDLRETIYPKEVVIHLNLPIDKLRGNNEILRVKLTLDDTIVLGISETGRYLFSLEREGVIEKGFNSAWASEFLNLKVQYNKDSNSYEILINDSNDVASIVLKGLLFFDITDKEIVVNDKLIIHKEGSKINITEDTEGYLSKLISKGDNHTISLTRSLDHFILVDEKHPYYRKKRLKLFASSTFQSYFPKERTEYEIGSVGKEFEINLLNKSVPSVPSLNTDLLLSSNKYKKNSNSLGVYQSDHLIRITLEKEFMLEGVSNKLGIILGSANSSNEDNSSYMGQDITKYSYVDWKKNELEKYINRNPDLVLKKYLVELEQIDLNGQSYSVLICQPYYNVKLKKWQVVLSFKSFSDTQTAFVRIKGFKICSGYDNDSRFKYSDISEDEHIPIYNKRVFKIQKGRTNGQSVYLIRNESSGNLKNKVFVLMQSKSKSSDSMVNISCTLDSDKLQKFSVIESLALGDQNKKVICYDKNEIVIKARSRGTLFLFEFEVHDNYNGPSLNNSEMYLEENPMFWDKQGLRLIHIEQIEV